MALEKLAGVGTWPIGQDREPHVPQCHCGSQSLLKGTCELWGRGTRTRRASTSHCPICVMSKLDVCDNFLVQLACCPYTGQGGIGELTRVTQQVTDRDPMRSRRREKYAHEPSLHCCGQVLPLRVFRGSQVAVLLVLRPPEGAVRQQASVETTLEAQGSDS